jgi:hypothetical protein
VSGGGWAVHVALGKVERARTVYKEVGVAKLQIDIYAREFRTIYGVRGRGGDYQNFDACVRGRVGGSRVGL